MPLIHRIPIDTKHYPRSLLKVYPVIKVLDIRAFGNVYRVPTIMEINKALLAINWGEKRRVLSYTKFFGAGRLRVPIGKRSVSIFGRSMRSSP